MSGSGGAVRSLSHRIGWSFINSMSGLVASTVTLLVVSRVVEPHAYGRVSVVIAAWGLLLTPVTWCGSLLMRFGPIEYEASGRLHRTLRARLHFIWLTLPLLCIGGLAYFGLALHWSHVELALTLAWILSTSAGDPLLWAAVAAQRFAPMTLANVSLRAAPLVLLCMALVHPMTVSADMLLGANVAGSIVAVVIYLTGLRGIVGVAPLDRELLRQMWRYARPLLWGVPGQAAVLWLDPLLLDHWAPAADVGRYQLAYPTFTVFAALGAAVNAVLSPELVRATAAGRPEVVTRYATQTQPWLALAGGLAAFGGACVAPPLLHLVLPVRYAMTADLVAILSIAGGFLLGFWSLLPLVTVTDSVAAQQVSTILQAVINVGLDIALAPRYGSVGVAMANVFAWAVSYASLTLFMRRSTRVPRWPILAVSAGAVAALAVVRADWGTPARALAASAFLLVAGLVGARLYRTRSA